MTRSLAVLLFGAVLAGCAKPALYQPMADDVGYGEQRLEQNRYRVWFAGNTATPRETVENYVLYRTAELTLANGYDYFVLSDRSTAGTDGDHHHGGPRVGFGLGGFRFGGRGGVSFGIGVGTPVGHEREKFYGQVDAVLMKGRKPRKDPNAFDAREIKANLEPTIVRAPP